MNTPHISFIVPVYNTSKYLAKCLDSMLYQTLNNIEIICVNDCSTDNSLEILKEYEKKDPRLIVINLKENLKQGGARNRGIEKARGKYLCFVDSDDWIATNVCEKLYSLALKNDADMVRAKIYHYFSENDIKEEYLDEKLFEMDTESLKIFHAQNGGRVCGGIIKRELFTKYKIKFPEHLFYEDNAINVLLYLLCNKIVYSEDFLYFYRQNNVSTTRNINNYRFFDRLETSKMFIENMHKYGLYEKYKDELDFYFIKLFYIYTVIGAIKNFTPPEVGYIKKVTKDIVKLMPKYRKNKYYQLNFSKKYRIFFDYLLPLVPYLSIKILSKKI